LVKSGSRRSKGVSPKQGSSKPDTGSQDMLNHMLSGSVDSVRLTASSGNTSSLMVVKDSDLASCRESGGGRGGARSNSRLRRSGGKGRRLLPADPTGSIPSVGSNRGAGSNRGDVSNQGHRDMYWESSALGLERSGTAPGSSGSGGGRQKSRGILDDLGGASPVSPLPPVKVAAAAKGIVGEW
jgi:hypothetical protein